METICAKINIKSDIPKSLGYGPSLSERWAFVSEEIEFPSNKSFYRAGLSHFLSCGVGLGLGIPQGFRFTSSPGSVPVPYL